MTLIEKFENYFDPKWLNKETSAHYCEKIADEFAIEFAEWVRENYYDVGNSWCEWNSDKDTYSSKELLEVFKKERNL